MKPLSLEAQILLQAEIDPVCGKPIDETNPDVAVVVAGGRRYLFCSPRCRRAFLEEPERYAEDVVDAER